MQTVYGKITDFFTNLKWDDLPPEVKKEAKRAVLDAVGCLFAGLKTPLGQGLCKMVPQNQITKGATMIGGGENLNPMFAAMANGYLCNALDADDGHRGSRLHSGGIIIPAAFAALQDREATGVSDIHLKDRLLRAALQDRDATGTKLLEAVVAGYEMAHRAGIASRASGLYYGSAYGGTFGAAAASSWLMDLSPEQCLNALGVAEMHAPNCLLMGWIENRTYPMVKEGMGWSAASGLMSSQLSASGVSGSLTIFETSQDVEKPIDFDALGTYYETTRLYYKPYPGCRWTHAPVQILLSLLETHDIKHQDVTRVDVYTFKQAVNLDSIVPKSIEEAQYSVPFVVGAALLDREFGPKQICAERLNDPAIEQEAKKINLIADEKFSALYPDKLRAKVEIHTKDGQVFTMANTSVWGDADNPLSDRDLQDKFMTLTQQSVSAKKAEELLELLWNIETASSVNHLIGLLHKATLID